MRYVLRPVSLAVLALFVLAGCASTATHRSTGETIDDASITAAVKTKLAEEKMSTLTKIDVDTNRGTVILNGTVDDEVMKAKAGSLAREVKGVHQVVNNLKVKGS